MKKIAITQRLIENETYAETRDALDIRWANIFKALNYLPIVLPTDFDHSVYFSEIKIDGIILSGGNDLSSISKNNTSIKRDEQEIKLIKYAIQKEIPVLGICRGMQLMTDHFGGKLEKITNHVGNKHAIILDRASRFYKPLKNCNKVNSYHNYAVIKVPDGFNALAIAEDGSIEAMENNEKKLLAIMWHPERNEPIEHTDLDLIKLFFND
ncbi:MAG: type 1 glutamine amidotransferase [Bacteroidia bacterium]|nr:type 1 glutamine amidotransferase [Bacteroidia bacterium]